VRGEVLICSTVKAIAGSVRSQSNGLAPRDITSRDCAKFVLIAAFIPMAVLVAFVYLDLRHMGQEKL